LVQLPAHDRGKILRFDVTGNPTAGWLARKATEAFPWDTAPRYLLRDRDASYGQGCRKQVDAMGITEVVSAARSPWQNAYVERVIGSLRRECLDHEQRERLEKEGDDAAAELSALLTRLLDELQS
jgi:transposase InsO family protein